VKCDEAPARTGDYHIVCLAGSFVGCPWCHGRPVVVRAGKVLARLRIGGAVDRFERHQVTESWPEQASETILSVGMVVYNLNLHCKF
jgi:hypothetical protein